MKNLIIIIILVVIPVSSYSQVKELPDPIPNFAAIIISDFDKSIEWYSNSLGFEVINRVDSEERGFSQANLWRGSAKLELIEISNTASQTELLEANPEFKRVEGFFKFGFTVDHFDDWIKYLEDIKVQFNGNVVEDPQSGKRMVIILDPDGNRIQIFEK